MHCGLCASAGLLHVAPGQLVMVNKKTLPVTGLKTDCPAAGGCSVSTARFTLSILMHSPKKKSATTLFWDSVKGEGASGSLTSTWLEMTRLPGFASLCCNLLSDPRRVTSTAFDTSMPLRT